MGLLPMVWYGSSIFYIIYGDSTVLADLGGGKFHFGGWRG